MIKEEKHYCTNTMGIRKADSAPDRGEQAEDEGDIRHRDRPRVDVGGAPAGCLYGTRLVMGCDPL